MNLLTFFILACIALGLASNPHPNPGAKLRITRHGLDYANLIGSYVLNNQLKTLRIDRIPEIRIQGGGRIKFENITVNSFNEPKYEYSLQSPSTFSWSLRNAGIEISVDWWAKKWLLVLFEGKGSLIANASQINITLTSKFGRNSTIDTGRPRIISAKCKSNIGLFLIEAKSGTLATIFNQFKDMISLQLKPILEKELCMRAKGFLLKDANAKLDNITLTWPVNRLPLILDYSLVSDPVVNSDHIEIAMKGRISPITNPSITAPYIPEPLTEIYNGKRMLYMWVSDTILNDFLFFAHVSNFSQYTISKNTPGAESVLKLRCNASSTCLSSAISDISTMFPDTVEYGEIFLATSKPPIMIIRDDGIATFTIDGIMDLYAFIPNGTNEKAVKKSVMLSALTLKAELRLRVQDGRAIGNFSITQLGMQIQESQMDGWTAMMLEIGIPGMLKPELETFVNHKLSIGYEIPITPGISLIKPELRLLNRTVQIESDVQYVG